MLTRRSKQLIGALTLLLIVGYAASKGAYYALQHGYVRFNYPSETRYPVQGLDVSHHQGPIDWQRVATTAFRFVYIKATEGGDFLDPRFKENWEAAREHDFVVGAYHFYTFCRPVADQIANIKATVPNESRTLPVAIDIEFGGNCSKRPASEDLVRDLDQLVSELTAHYGRSPIYYLTRDFDAAYPAVRQMGLDIWIRNVFWEPGAQPIWAVWQYSNRGRVPGIAVPVDLNAFRGSVASFDAWLDGARPSE